MDSKVPGTLIAYPATPSEEAETTLAGITFRDPFRRLEGDDERVRSWQRAQAQLAREKAREWPHFERLRALVATYSIEQRHGEQYTIVPRFAAGLWFRTRVAEGASHSHAIVAAEPTGDGHVLFDPATENRERPPVISWLAPSPDGRTLAIGVCADGSENNTIRLVDVASGRALSDSPAQVLMDNWTGGAQWLPDSSGFFFSAVEHPGTEFAQFVYFHRRGPKQGTGRLDIPWITPKDYRWVVVSREGRWAVAMERLVDPIPVAVCRLGQGRLEWRPFVRALKGRLAGQPVDDRFIAVTNVGAPRGRIVSIPLDCRDPAEPSAWSELVGESEAAIQTVTPVGQLLYLSELVDTYARVRVVDFAGRPKGEVALPDVGALGIGWWYSMHGTLPKGHPEQFLFTFSSFRQSRGIYRHVPGQALETLDAPLVRIEDVVVEDRWAVSADGTRIPYHLVRRSDVDVSRPQPCLVYAYGGFNYPLVAQFPGPMEAFVAAGGCYVHAHLRGGSEFGDDWASAGRLENKPRAYEDLYAVAEDLIAARRTTPRLLAMTGRSLGGLLAGVAVTQRPDLWAVVIPRVPLLDLIGMFRKSSYGSMAIAMEIAGADSAEDVRRLAAVSPYHLVRDGVDYPAVYIDAGDTDPRCEPWHARKFAARLQQATGGDAPIVLHVWENAGHGLATDPGLAIEEQAEWLAFTMHHLGMGDVR